MSPALKVFSVSRCGKGLAVLVGEALEERRSGRAGRRGASGFDGRAPARSAQALSRGAGALTGRVRRRPA